MHDVTFQAACAAFLGVASCTVGAMLGVEPQALIYAFVGAAGGLICTERGGRWRALALFVPSVIGGAIGGTVAATHWYGGGKQYADLLGMGLAAVFPVILSWGIKNMGKILDAAARRFGVGQ